MNLKPGSLEWARHAIRNAQQSCQRASDVLLKHELPQEAFRAEQIRAAAEELADRLTPEDSPKKAA